MNLYYTAPRYDLWLIRSHQAPNVVHRVRSSSVMGVESDGAGVAVHRPALVETLARRAEMEGCRIDVLLQLSLCGEPQKGGCKAEQAAELARQVRSCPSLRLSGLMTVPAADPDPEAARPVFRALRELRAALAQ